MTAAFSRWRLERVRAERRIRLKLFGLFLLMLAAAFCSLRVGHLPIAAGDVLAAFIDPDAVGVNASAAHIVWNVRLPRVLTALMAGGALALSGAALQGVFRNPLVDPHIIGVTSGSAFGGTLAILLGFPLWALTGFSLGFGLLALFLVCLSSKAAMERTGGRDRLCILLSGIIVAGVFSALVSMVQYCADSEETLPSIVFWLMGSFASSDWRAAGLLSGVTLSAAFVLMKLRWRLNILSLDERDAVSLAGDLTSLRRGVLFLAALLVAAQVSVSGSIGWVGLVVPHGARKIVGQDHRALLPASFFLGAAFMVLVDDTARTLTAAEIPLGILTALVGAPLFAWLLLSKTSPVHSLRRRPCPQK